MPRLIHFQFILISMISALSLSPAAFAHAHLQQRIPAADSIISQAPKELQLSFSEGIEPAFSQITLKDQSGHSIPTGKIKILNPENSQISIAIKQPLNAGQYTVNWQIVSVDTHKTNGHYQFTVK